MEHANCQIDFEAPNECDIIPETDSSESYASQTSEIDFSLINDSYVSETPTESDEEIQSNNFNIENDVIFETDPSDSENSNLHSGISEMIISETSSEDDEESESALHVKGPDFQTESNVVSQSSANEIHCAENQQHPIENDEFSHETASENDDDSRSNHMQVFENEIIPGTESSSSDSEHSSRNGNEIRAEIEQSIPETPSASDEEGSSIHTNATDNDIILETDSEASRSVGNEHYHNEADDLPIDNELFVPETPSASDDESNSNPISEANDVISLQTSNYYLLNEGISITSPVFNDVHTDLANSMEAQVVDNEFDLSQIFLGNFEPREMSPRTSNPSANAENDRTDTNAELMIDEPIEALQNQSNEEIVVVAQNEPQQNNLQAIQSQRERDFPFLVPGTIFLLHLKYLLYIL